MRVGERSVSELAADYDMSFAAVQKHVAVLEGAGLVTKEHRGRERAVRGNPERIVVGGYLAEAGEVLLEPMRQTVERYALRAAVEHLEIVAGALGSRAELLGSLVLVLGQSDRVPAGRLRAALGG